MAAGSVRVGEKAAVKVIVRDDDDVKEKCFTGGERELCGGGFENFGTRKLPPAAHALQWLKWSGGRWQGPMEWRINSRL